MRIDLIVNGVSIYNYNIYDTLGVMASQVTLSNGKTLYDILWSPKDHGIKYGKDISYLLDEAHKILKSNKPKYKAFNPENRLGTFTGLCEFIDSYKNICLDNPDAEIIVFVDNFKYDAVSQLIKTLHNNRVIRFVHGQNKLLQPIPYDFRIDRCCSSEHINNIGELMADKFIQIENEIGLKFDSVFCSLFSGVFIGVSMSMVLLHKYNRNIKVAISRRSYHQKMGQETGTETFISSIHQLKNKTLVGELGENVLVFDEMTNTGVTIKELINISKLNGVTPKAAMIIADRILENPIGPDHIRMYDEIPCYSCITHYEIVDWCNENPHLWNSLYEQMYDNQNTFTDEELQAFQKDVVLNG